MRSYKTTYWRDRTPADLSTAHPNFPEAIFRISSLLFFNILFQSFTLLERVDLLTASACNDLDGAQADAIAIFGNPVIEGILQTMLFVYWCGGSYCSSLNHSYQNWSPDHSHSRRWENGDQYFSRVCSFCQTFVTPSSTWKDGQLITDLEFIAVSYFSALATFTILEGQSLVAGMLYLLSPPEPAGLSLAFVDNVEPIAEKRGWFGLTGGKGIRLQGDEELSKSERAWFVVPITSRKQ